LVFVESSNNAVGKKLQQIKITFLNTPDMAAGIPYNTKGTTLSASFAICRFDPQPSAKKAGDM